MPYGDQGVVLLGASSTTPTVVDRRGQTVSAIALTTSYQAMNAVTVPSSLFSIGAGESCLITVQAVLGGVTSYEIALQIRRVDPTSNASGVTWKWADVQITPLDGSSTAAVAQSIVAANLLEPDGATAADFCFGTTSHRMSCEARIIAKYSGGALGGTSRLIVAVAVL